MNKEKKVTVQLIQDYIQEWGIFDITEVVDAIYPSVPTRGSLVSLVEGFQTDSAIVVVYNRGNDIVDTYRLSYEDMPLGTLKKVLVVCLLYQQLQLDLGN